MHMIIRTDYRLFLVFKSFWGLILAFFNYLLVCNSSDDPCTEVRKRFYTVGDMIKREFGYLQQRIEKIVADI